MLKAHELRIGNYFQAKGETKAVFCVRDGEDINDLLRYQSYEPIPLTPEIVERAWLKVYDIDKNEGYGQEPFIHFCPNSGEHRYVIDTNENDHGEIIYTTIPIQYVHQLQNLFFDLSGEDVIVKP